jgi:hypothetical protein
VNTPFGEGGDVLASHNQAGSTSRTRRTWRFQLSRDCALSPLCEGGTGLRFMGERRYPEITDSLRYRQGCSMTQSYKDIVNQFARFVQIRQSLFSFLIT